MNSQDQYDIDSLLEEVVTLPSMPDSLARLNRLLDDPDVSMRQLAAAISADPSIAMKTLRLVNSAYYGLGQEVTTVEHAVVLLGVRVIKNLVLTAAVFEVIRGSAVRFLRHAVSCAVAMRTLAGHGQLAKAVHAPEEAFVFGLLHEIGKVILGEYLPEQYANVADLARSRGMPWHEAEQQIIGVDHAALGAQLARNWRLSPMVVNAIAGQHDLDRCPPEHQVLAANLAVANYICAVCGFGSELRISVELSDPFWQAAALDRRELPRVLNDFFFALPEIDELLQLAD